MDLSTLYHHKEDIITPEVELDGELLSKENQRIWNQHLQELRDKLIAEGISEDEAIKLDISLSNRFMLTRIFRKTYKNAEIAAKEHHDGNPLLTNGNTEMVWAEERESSNHSYYQLYLSLRDGNMADLFKENGNILGLVLNCSLTTLGVSLPALCDFKCEPFKLSLRRFHPSEGSLEEDIASIFQSIGDTLLENIPYAKQEIEKAKRFAAFTSSDIKITISS